MSEHIDYNMNTTRSKKCNWSNEILTY